MAEKCDIIKIELSEEAKPILCSALETAMDAYLEGFYADKAPADCPFVVTCGSLIIIDRNASPEIAAEIRATYDNNHCLGICAYNVQNPGCLPKMTLTRDERDHQSIPGDING